MQINGQKQNYIYLELDLACDIFLDLYLYIGVVYLYIGYIFFNLFDYIYMIILYIRKG